MSDPIKVGMIRCDTHGAYYAALMSGFDPFKLRDPVPRETDPPHSWMNGAVHYYFHGFCADPKQFTVEAVKGFKIVKLWDEQREVARALSDILEPHPEVCDTPEQVSEGVDLVFIGDCNEDGSDHLALASPGLEKGVATFIDKPLANTVEDMDAIVSLSRRTGAPVFSASMLRHLPGPRQFASRLVEIGGADSGFIRGGGGHIAGQVHTVSLAQVVFGAGIQEVRATGPGELGMVHLSWGDRDDRPRDGVVMHQNISRSYHCSMYVSAYGPDGAILANNTINDWHFPYGAATILKLIRKMVRTGEVDDSMNDMIEAVTAVNAGRLSMEQSGRAVELEEVRQAGVTRAV